MKKILFITLALLPFLFFGCEKGLENHTVMVNVDHQYSDSPEYGNKIASPSFVFIYKDNGKTVDGNKSHSSVNSGDGQLTYTDGSISGIPEYICTDLSGVNTFYDIPNGSYIIWVTFKQYTYIRYSMFKKVVITENDNEIIFYNPLIDCDKNLGIQAWNEKK